MGGWGRKLMLITPNGDALPCHAAQVIPGLAFENVRDRSLCEIWEQSATFQKFRGEAWMQEPCKNLRPPRAGFRRLPLPGIAPRGDAAATDPVCSLSPLHSKVDAILAGINTATSAQIFAQPSWLYRPNPV